MHLRSSFLKSSLLAVAVVASGCPAPKNGVPDGGGHADLPDAGAPDSGTPDGGDDCLALSLGQQSFQANLFGQLTGVRFAVTPGVDGELPESLFVELYDSTTPDLPALQPGTFALGTAPNDDLATCQHCVWLPVDWDGFSPLSTVFFATEGSLTLTEVEDPLTSIIAGSTTELVLREAAIDESGAMALVDGGRCARVPAFTFDTSPTPGRACLSAEDCGNPLLEVCSPATSTCAPHECGEEDACPAERPMCLSQYGDRYEGACYAVCDPTGPAGCGVGRSCVQLGVHPGDGICLTDGTATLGATCAVEDTSTSCAPGMRCSTASQACTRTCQFFDAAPGCQANHACSLFGVCEPGSAGVAVGLGEACGDTAALTQGCAADAGAFRGFCFSFEPTDPLVCEKACLGELGCENGEFCALRFTSGLGICLPIPVCGDGVLGEINEICDDGNTTSGDGCSADCQTVEYGPICGGAPQLTSGAIQGDTTQAWDGFQATCQLGAARAQVYRFDPPSRGRLRLTLDSQKTHALSVRSACADAQSELACTSVELGSGSALVHQVTAPGELSLLVSANTILEHGPFTLNTEFTPEQCGDGVVAGLEVCDDGNTSSNDGCSSDCATVEYAFYCGQAPALMASASGDNTGAPALYTTSCTGSVLGDGLDRLFRYTAPSAGTVRFRLQPDAAVDADLVLAVFDGCGAPSTMTELGCSSVYDVEQVDVQVTAGQTLTVLVEGFHPHSVSPFTLSAQLLP